MCDKALTAATLPHMTFLKCLKHNQTSFFLGGGGINTNFKLPRMTSSCNTLKPRWVSPASLYLPSVSESDCLFLIHSKTAQVGWPGENKKVLCAAPRLSEEDMTLFTVVSLKKWPSVGTRAVKSSWQFTMDVHMAHPKLRAHNIGAQHDDPPPTFRTHAANKTGLLTGIKVNF